MSNWLHRQKASSIEQELGITPGLLSKWRRGYGMGGSHKGKSKSNNAEEEIEKLKRENARLRQE